MNSFLSFAPNNRIFFFCILILSIEGSKRLIIQQQNKQSKQQKYTNGSNERNQQHGRNDGHRHRWWPNKVQPLIKQYFDREIFGQEVFISLLDFFMIFGAMGSYLLSDKLGRKSNFATAAMLFLVGIVLQAAAFNYWLLLVGRSLVGIGAGIGFAIDPVYIAEISPSRDRGFLVGFSEIVNAFFTQSDFISTIVIVRPFFSLYVWPN